MLPGKKYKIDDVLAILRRRYWLVLVPFAVLAAGASLYARTMPKVYQAKVKILVVPARVPENFVKATVTMRIGERLQQIRQTIMSRSRLEQMIRDFDLYKDEQKTMIMEDIADRMRDRDAQLIIARTGDSFDIVFRGPDPRTVQKVAEALGSAFINESLRDREGLADGTSTFMEASLDDTRRRLEELERQLAEYRRRNAGTLPSQLDSNIQAITRLSAQATQLTDAIKLDRNQKMIYVQQLAILESPDATAADLAAVGGTNAAPAVPLTPLQQQLKAEQANLAALLTKFSGEHPDVKMATSRVADLEKQVGAEDLRRPVSSGVALPTLSLAEQQRRLRIKNIQDQILQLDAQVVERETKEKDVRAAIANVQGRIDVVPDRESEMQSLTRDHATMTQLYGQQLARREEARTAASLEKRQIGEQFKMLETATLPQKPISPNKPLITLFGVAAGLIIGVGFIALLEYRDSTFKTDDEIASYLTLPVLAVVPVMESEQDRRVSARKKWILRLTLGSTVAGCLAILAYTFVR